MSFELVFVVGAGLGAAALHRKGKKWLYLDAETALERRKKAENHDAAVLFFHAGIASAGLPATASSRGHRHKNTILSH